MAPNPKLQDLTSERAIHAFQRAGYHPATVAGTHCVLRHPNRPALLIPRHQPLKTGLLLDKIRLAGLTPEDFAALL